MKYQKRLSEKFFVRPTLKVARELLGKVIVRRIDGKLIKGRILETEAYIGEDDRACHARFGRTTRNAPMYKKGGRTYIYLCYGLFNLLNFVTEEKDYPAAVLIRKIEPLSGNEKAFKSYGPGNLTKYLQIDRKLNDQALERDELSIIDDGFSPSQVVAKERIGIAYAEKHAKRKWRFILIDDRIGSLT